MTTHFGAGMIPWRQAPSAYTRLTAFLAPADPSRPPLPSAAADLEPALLGLLLGDWSSWRRILQRLTPEDFTDSRHRLIFQAVKTRFGKGRSGIPAPFVLSGDWRDLWGSPEEMAAVGGEEYLRELSQVNPLSNSDRFVDRLIRDLQALRKDRPNKGAEK
ncbi:MAG: hypothetical protein GX442_21685 [Candidatus Riflebacteria bacterium]|nr:hypothetical protein [Candidatus Riflebacteria bacterium]